MEKASPAADIAIRMYDVLRWSSMSWRVFVWFSVRASVFVWCRSCIVIVSPSLVRWKFIVSVGVKVCWIGPAVVFAFIVNVGVISSVYVVVLVPVSCSICVFSVVSAVGLTGCRVIWIIFWLVVVCVVWFSVYDHVVVLRVCVRL